MGKATEHPLSDIVEAGGIGIELEALMDALDDRAGEDFAVDAFYVRTDADCSTFCEPCADRNYDALIAKATPEEADEMFIVRDDAQMGPSGCDDCGATLEYYICESTRKQEMEHFLVHRPTAEVLHPTDAYGIARLAEHGMTLKVDDLNLMRDIRDLAVHYLALPDPPRNDALARKAA